MRTMPLRTLDPAAPPDDLAALDEAIGDARVVAIGESAHYYGESYRLRHRLLRYLVERHGFRAYAMETGFTEGARVRDWVGGAGDRLDEVLAHGITSLMGLWTPMRAHLRWMRSHGGVTFEGIDLGGSNASLLPGLDAVDDYLNHTDPAVRDIAATFAAASAFSAPAALAAYGQLTEAQRDTVAEGLADLERRLATGEGAAYDRAVRSLRLTTALATLARQMAAGDMATAMSTRDAAIADTVEWIAARNGRTVLAAHNGHVQRTPGVLPGMPPMTTAGQHLADRFGDDYLVIGMTTGAGEALHMGADFYTGTLFSPQPAPEPGSLDALMESHSDGDPFLTDLRSLSPEDTEAVRAASRQRFGAFYAGIDARAAYDLIVHLPRVTAAEPDEPAIACAPPEVRQAFAAWRTRPAGGNPTDGR
jgi:erythromycin esterase